MAQKCFLFDPIIVGKKYKIRAAIPKKIIPQPKYSLKPSAVHEMAFKLLALTKNKNKIVDLIIFFIKFVF